MVIELWQILQSTARCISRVETIFLQGEQAKEGVWSGLEIGWAGEREWKGGKEGAGL